MWMSQAAGLSMYFAFSGPMICQASSFHHCWGSLLQARQTSAVTGRRDLSICHCLQALRIVSQVRYRLKRFARFQQRSCSSKWEFYPSRVSPQFRLSSRKKKCSHSNCGSNLTDSSKIEAFLQSFSSHDSRHASRQRCQRYSIECKSSLGSSWVCTRAMLATLRSSLECSAWSSKMSSNAMSSARAIASLLWWNRSFSRASCSWILECQASV